MLSSLVQNLISLFEDFPGVGPKMAERFIYHLLKSDPQKLENLIKGINTIKGKIKSCPICQNFTINEICEICADSRRQKNTICVVAEPQDISAFEKTGEYRGVYHLLGGNLNAINNTTPDKLKIKELLARIKKMITDKQNVEIILGFNPNIEGETTSLYLTKLLKQFPIKITRLARGLSQGTDLEYADEITLLNAMKDRKEII